MNVGGRQFELTLASDVQADGLLLELDVIHPDSRETCALVFRSHVDGTTTFTAYQGELPLAAVEWLVGEARRRLKSPPDEPSQVSGHCNGPMSSKRPTPWGMIGAPPHRYTVPTREEVAARIGVLLRTETSREAVAEWAQAYLLFEDPQLYPEVHDQRVWSALQALSGADLRTPDRQYLHEAEDFRHWLDELWES